MVQVDIRRWVEMICYLLDYYGLLLAHLLQVIAAVHEQLLGFGSLVDNFLALHVLFYFEEPFFSPHAYVVEVGDVEFLERDC